MLTDDEIRAQHKAGTKAARAAIKRVVATGAHVSGWHIDKGGVVRTVRVAAERGFVFVKAHPRADRYLALNGFRLTAEACRIRAAFQALKKVESAKKRLANAEAALAAARNI